MTASLNELLKQTSRSFYLTLRVLPRAVRPQIGLAYLLARTTDTIADTEIVPLEQRLTALGLLRARIFGQKNEPLDFGELAQQQGLPAERTLLERVEDSLALLRTLSPEDLALVRKVIDTITGGQELDLMRFGTSALTPALSPGERENVAQPSVNRESSDSSQRGNKDHPLLGERAGVRAGHPTQIIALQQDTELDDYTYRVAGCVGEFWTKMCRAHLFSDVKLDDAQLLGDGVRFGKGLQLVNILRDLPRDLQEGRCYIPMEQLARVGLNPKICCTPRRRRSSARLTTSFSLKPKLTSKLAGATRTPSPAISGASGSLARGPSSSACGRLNCSAAATRLTPRSALKSPAPRCAASSGAARFAFRSRARSGTSGDPDDGGKAVASHRDLA